MNLSKEQLDALLALVAKTKEDSLDCDGCMEHIAEFAETTLADRPLPEALSAVRTHLESCGCCRDEYRVLLEALRAIQAQEQP